MLHNRNKVSFSRCTLELDGNKYPLISNGVREIVARANNIYEAAALIVICQHNGDPYKRSMPEFAKDSRLGIKTLRKALSGLAERKIIAQKSVRTRNNMTALEHRPLFNVSDKSKFCIPRWVIGASDYDFKPEVSKVNSKDAYKNRARFNAFNLVLLMLVIDYKGYSDVNMYKEILRLMKSSDFSSVPIAITTLSYNFNTLVKGLVKVQGHVDYCKFVFDDRIAFDAIQSMRDQWNCEDRRVAEFRTPIITQGDELPSLYDAPSFNVASVTSQEHDITETAITKTQIKRPPIATRRSSTTTTTATK